MARCRKPILVVDDNVDLRDALAAVLEAEGYPVVEAADGEEALNQLRCGVEPAVVLLDLAMPRKDGREFRAEQTADPSLARIPVIIVSADREARTKAGALVGDAVVRKPVEPHALLDLVARYCRP